MRDRSVKTRKCPVCKTEFTTNRVNKVFCSHKCQVLHHLDEKYDKEQKMLKENEQLNDFKKKNAELVEKNNILTKQHDNIVDEIKNFTEGYGKIISNSDRMLVLHTNKRDDYIVFCKNCNKQHDVDGTTYLIFDKLQHKFRHYCAVCFKQTAFADMESDKKQTTLNLPE